MVKISGYHVIEELYNGSRTMVYRAVREDDQKPVVIKLLKNPYPNFKELLHFRNQYTIAKSLDILSIVRPYSLEFCDNSYALVMEDFGGISLHQYMHNGKFKSVVDILSATLQVAEILHSLHQNRVIHKDIKPANILINPQTKEIKLIDFSIASLLPLETQEIKNPNVLEGTLAYLSPEQTGRMNRGIDYRTDFYSLGVTLFELLVGELPFPTTDPMELLHCHIAHPVIFPDPSQEIIPAMVRAIVLKLMSKNAEDRYQNALGLKYDLEFCVQQWRAIGEITAFELGERDACDRFIVSEKLYGRKAEVQTLLDAFERVAAGKTEMMLVAGLSGIGKTAVVNEVHKPITRQQGYFIQGKFDQFNRNVPFSAFVQAFRSLMGQLLGEPDSALKIWKEKILQAVGESGQVILEVIPELEHIIGKQPAVPKLLDGAAQTRFNLLFGKFVRVFTTKEHPLVIFLDDLQWADSASLNLLKLLMDDSDSGYLLVLGAYRDNEVFPAHPLMLVLNEIGKQGTQLNTLTLATLDCSDITCLVADTLRCSAEVAVPLSQLVYQKTHGNPFFATQFLQGLYTEDAIFFNSEVGYWECDLAMIRQLAITDDVVEFMVGRLQKLPEATQEILKLAACIGNRFNLETLAAICEVRQDEVAADLWMVLRQGLVIPESETYKFFQAEQSEEKRADDISVGYRFLHDRVQQASYSLIPEDQKQRTHLRIGQLLLSSTRTQELETQIFNIANQLNIGIELINNKSERVELASLNLRAAQKAKKSIAYSAAVKYLNVGIKLLECEDWDNEYELKFNLHKECSEAEYLQGDIEKSEILAHKTLVKAKSAIEKVEIYNLLIIQHTVTAKYQDAINEGKIALDLLGIQWNENNLSQELDDELKSTRNRLGNRDIASLIDLPEIKVPEKRSAIAVLHNLLPATFSVNQELWSVLVVKMVNLSLQYGHTSECCFGYSFYGVLVISIFGDYESGYEFGILSLKLSQKFNDPAQQSKACNILAAFLLYWKKHISNCESINNQGYAAGLESGQLQFTGYIAYNRILSIFHSGKNLSEVLKDFPVYLPILDQIQHYYAYDITIGIQLAISNLITLNQETLTGRFQGVDEIKYLETCHSRKSFPAICIYQILKAQTLYLFDQPKDALKYLVFAKETLGFIAGHFTVIEHNYYHSLSLLVCYKDTFTEDKSRILEQVLENQEQLKVWAKISQENFQHKFDLVEAEISRNSQDKLAAMELYDSAITRAKKNKFIQDEALANELAAKFYLEWGKEKVAAGYMQEAYYCYARWGATAKTNRLEANYPQLLYPILQHANQGFDPLLTLTSIFSSNSVISTTSKKNQSSDQNANTALDFVTILKASQAISSTINIEELLRKITQIVLQNSGGDFCAIILCEPDGEVRVRAIATLDVTDLSIFPLKDAKNLPVQLIQYVKHTGETVVINSPSSNLPIVDRYFFEQRFASVLCLPLLDRTQLRGILYLGNRNTTGVFHAERQATLHLLGTQAAIALENAQLYQQAQDYAQQLEESQLQLVQSEKMSALGNLVAGVAHEINNPLGFVSGNIVEVRNFIHDITKCLQCYRKSFPEPGEDIENLLEDLDIDFLLEDLQKMLNSMKFGCDRIRGISNSLRIFSRADTESKFKANVHQGIDSTLLILKYRLKAKNFRPEIEVIRDYGELPEIECFPGQLNQVFMNLLANAIDMFDEIAQEQSFEELQANPQRITIQTQLIDSHSVEICISDNGKGMSEEVCSKIFDRQFTTKAVGKGTGLGLAIAYQVAVEKHSGSLEVQSKIGQGTKFFISLPLVTPM
ncbi:trifunctional serine/threonine-protein kinase/ATP-binding protein/sensor histidine kinase [Mastigocoleus testarum]|nr:ATP-binding sensor histidine kinase [Mastigocoleus testarum]